MRARLTYQDYDGKTVTVELSADSPVTIGRSQGNNVVLRDEHASRMHCRVHFDRGQWWIRDFGLNGSKINGARIDQESQLRHGDEVRIGDTRMRFTELDATGTGPTTKRINIPSPADPPPSTRLQHDDLTVLCNFMAAAVRETDSQGLLRKALDVVLHQTSAYLVGFLSGDLNEPVTKMVAPETAKVDPQLSRNLIKRVHRDGRAVWLCTDMADTRTPDSAAPCSDALCLPVRSAVGRLLGTLHVYRTNTYFAERDLRFCGALVIYLANALHMMRNQKTLQAENLRLRRRSPAAEDLVGDSDTLRELRSVISRVAHSPAPVLIQGESGAGKELVAVSLHNHSDRAGGPLVTVNCHAIAPSLFEGELFGYLKGAFSGAETDHDGFLVQADDGTLFLDEVAELPAEVQARLVRVLEGRGYKQVGGTQVIQADVRILAATNRDLAAEVKAGRFREDLFKRLKVITIEVPALREHLEDVPILVQYFLDKIGGDHRRQYRLTDAALDKLRTFRWPGNVRQLRAVLENAAALAAGELLDVSDFRLEIQPRDDSDLPLDLEKLEAWAVRTAMKRAGDNKTRAAQLLGIGRDALYAKIDKYGVG